MDASPQPAGERAADPAARLVPARHRHRRSGRALERPDLALPSARLHDRARARSSATARRAIPAGMSIQDWGITYDELEPYYDKFEYMAGIAGKAGNLKGQQIDGGNVFEGPRSREFPRAAAAGHARSARCSARRRLSSGTTRSRGPTANLPKAYKNPDGIERGPCTYCGFCERFGCEVGAKADPTVTVIPVALKTGKFKVINYANAFAIKNDGKKAQSVLYYDAHGPRAGAAGRRHRARRVRVQQRPPAARLEARQAVRPGLEHAASSAGTTPTRRAAAGRAAWFADQRVQALHGRGRHCRSRSTTSTPTTSTTPGSASSAAARSASVRAARARSRA